MAYDVIIIGGGPAGLSAAVNVRSRGRSALVVSGPIEENPLWKAERVDNYLGLPGSSGRELLERFRSHAEELGADFREGRVISALSMGSEWMIGIGSDVENAKAVVFSGGVVRGSKFPGEEEFLGKGVSYCATCDGMLYRNRSVVVAGFSDSAAKEADFLSSIGCSVSYFDRPKKIAILGSDRAERMVIDAETVEADCIFILRPSLAPSDLFRDIALKDGYVETDRDMSTNLPGLFAAGDCTGGPLQVSKAAGDGLVAGQSAAKYASEHSGK